MLLCSHHDAENNLVDIEIKEIVSRLFINNAIKLHCTGDGANQLDSINEKNWPI